MLAPPGLADQPQKPTRFCLVRGDDAILRYHEKSAPCFGLRKRLLNSVENSAADTMDAITGVRGWILKQTGWNNVMFRAAVALTLTYWIGALVAAPALYFSEPQSGWLAFDLFDVVELVFGVYALPLSALLWIGFAALRFAGGERTRVLVVLGLAAPFLYHVALHAAGRSPLAVRMSRWPAANLAATCAIDVSLATA
jgi:hypothetical protein